jgi:uncharacterized protein YdeI (YjbR/CyaY-like superfamily)
MANITEQYHRVEARDRKKWRAWLEKNHARSPGVWLVFYKKSAGTATVRYDEAVEEALCFGWIDSLMKPVDEQRYRQLFTPRKPKSRWSQPNKERVARMIAAGLMTEVGMAKIRAAKKDGSWAHMKAPDSLVVPPDLRRALNADERAKEGFARMPPGKRRQLLGWIHDAKRPETRQRRITQAVEVAAGRREL